MAGRTCATPVAAAVCLAAATAARDGRIDEMRLLLTRVPEDADADALGVASTLLLLRDFDNASCAFDASRHPTHDKDEQKFLTSAIGDLATIRGR